MRYVILLAIILVTVGLALIFYVVLNAMKLRSASKNEIISDEDLRKKVEILYFDEFQVTNIVDAMILGRLFKKIFEEKIKVIFTSNINIHDLYKDGLQREQFTPFIKILKKKFF